MSNFELLVLSLATLLMVGLRGGAALKFLEWCVHRTATTQLIMQTVHPVPTKVSAIGDYF